MANMKYQSYRVRYRATPDSEEETQHVVAPYGCDENDLAAMLKVSKSSHSLSVSGFSLEPPCVLCRAMEEPERFQQIVEDAGMEIASLTTNGPVSINVPTTEFKQ